MDTKQIANLLRPFATLDEKQLGQTLMYVKLIIKWNARVNLTAVRKPEDIVTRHFGESYFVGRHALAAGEAAMIADLGSGAGFPGLPLALLAPQAQVTLIESNHKKAAFLNEVVRTLTVGNAKVFTGRGEDYPEKADVVTMRAVEKFDLAITVASRIVNSGGRLALMIGKSQVEAAKKVNQSLIWSEPIEIPGGHSRVLLTGRNQSR